MTINEIARLRVGFKSFAPSSDGVEYFQETARNSTITFALQEVDAKDEWKLIWTDFSYGSFEMPRMYDYRSGLVFEAESGKRLVQGKKVSAETYIQGLNATPITDVAAIPGVRIDALIQSKAESKAEILHNSYFGYVFDEGTSSLVEDEDDGGLNLNIPIVNMNNLVLVFFAPNKYESPKVLKISGDDGLRQRTNIHPPMTGGNMELF